MITKQKVLSLMFFVLTLNCQAQLKIPTSYSFVGIKSSDVNQIYCRTFPSKSKAIRDHLHVLDVNNVDTNYIDILYDLDCPIFSNFYLEEDDAVFISMVIKNLETNDYNSIFLRCKNVTLDFCDSDSQTLHFEPTLDERDEKRRKKD